MVANAVPFRIVYKARALADIESIRKFIAEDNAEAADRYAIFLLTAVEKIANLPTACRVYQHFVDPKRSVRFKPVDSHIIYFRTDEVARTMTVLTIRHGRRRARRFR